MVLRWSVVIGLVLSAALADPLSQGKTQFPIILNILGADLILVFGIQRRNNTASHS
jgi:hypothetical protein